VKAIHQAARHGALALGPATGAAAALTTAIAVASGAAPGTPGSKTGNAVVGTTP
jgi:hypothetical protein